METIRKRKSAADRKAEIVETVLDLSHTLGPARVTTQHLADAVGVTQPAIFRHFATKADIWTEVGAKIRAEVDALPMSVVPSENAAEQLRAHVGEYFDLVSRYPALPSILASRDLQTEHDSLRETIQSIMARRLKAMTEVVRHGLENKHFHPDIDPQATAAVLLSTIEGICQRWALEARGFDLPGEGGILIDAVLDRLHPA